MSLNNKVQDAINEQINKELGSAYIYQAMGAYFASNNLKGFAHWMDIQVQEEMIHARKFYDFILDRGGKVQFKALSAPPSDWKSPLDAFEKALEHEKFITNSIGELLKVARSENDLALEVLLQWFITEQVEEEANADDIVHQIKRVGDNSSALFMLDKELGARPMPAGSNSQNA